jgi:catechol 2,3-dioxygenase-like lactoylglutathione lyase family enzyme
MLELPAKETNMGTACAVTGLFHVLVKTNDLPQTLRFYRDVLGMREAKRPPFGNPGVWLMCPTPSSDIIIHVWSGGAAFGPTDVSPLGTATIDHVSLTAIGHEAFRKRFKEHGLPWREFIIPETTLWQLFVYDPSGVQIELTFDAAGEAEPHGPIAPENLYTPGENFFDPATYPRL